MKWLAATLLALALGAPSVRGLAAETGPGGVPGGPLADAIEALAAQAASPSACPDPRACPGAVRSLAAARLGLCTQPSRALSRLGSALQGLERAGLLADGGPLRSAVESAAEAANALVGD